MSHDQVTEEPPIANTSGNRSSVIPLQVQGGSWGAFVFGGVWALCNGVWFGALSLLMFMAPAMLLRCTLFNTVTTLLGLAVWVYITVRGRSLAWAHKRWDSYDQFDAVQRKWSKVAKVTLPVVLIGAVVLTVVFFLLLAQGLSAMKG